jgi:endonuclease YncB( thermonuclease family)
VGRNLFNRIAAYPLWKQTLLYLALYLAALIALGLSVLFSPLVMFLAGLALMAAIFVLVVRFLRSRPLSGWGLVALTSFVLLLVFTSISNALYFSVQPEQASSLGPDERTASTGAPPGPPERVQKDAGGGQPNQTRQDADQADAKLEGQPSAAGRDDPEASQPSVIVKRVIDGDTIEISPSVGGKNTVTLVGIDAPEIGKSGCGPQPLSQEATDHASLWEGRKVRLEFDRERTGEDGGLLAYVRDPKNAKMMNVEMVQSGYAQVHVVPPNTKHGDELTEAQDRAKSVSRGFGMDIWSLPPAEAAQLADRSNGIGEGGGACPPESQVPRSARSPSASSSASPSPSPNANQDAPAPNTPNLYAPSSASPSASPFASPAVGGSSSSAPPAAGGG